MISLKKYLDADVVPPCVSEPDPRELLAAVVRSYRSALLATGENGIRACRAVGSELQENLAGLASRLSGNLTISDVQKTDEQVDEQLRLWGDQSEEYFKAKTNDVKELLIVLARTAESLGQRDQRYATQFTQFKSRLQAIADLEDLTQMRASLVQRATELNTYVAQMEEDSHQSLARLHAEVSTYETKLNAAEDLALRDVLTGLANRRDAEKRIAWRIAHQQSFCVAILDLDEFKPINDHYGHPAGDSVLQQIAQELKAHTRCTDLAARWGGDEFIVVLDCDLATAEGQVDRIRQWVCGNYTIQLASEAAPAKVSVAASVGVAQWQNGESLEQLIKRADSAMYQEKKLRKRKNVKLI